jgi:hypothetical protein
MFSLTQFIVRLINAFDNSALTEGEKNISWRHDVVIDESSRLRLLIVIDTINAKEPPLLLSLVEMYQQIGFQVDILVSEGPLDATLASRV